VQAFKGNVAAAQYGAAYRLNMALRMFPLVYADGLAQPAARLAREDRKGLEEVLNRAMSQLYIAGLAIGIGGFLLAKPIMVAVFGAQYDAAATAVALLFLTMPMTFAFHPCVIVALAMGLEKQIAKIFAVTVITNIGANAILIPLDGPSGAAATMILSTFILYGLTARMLWQRGIRFTGRKRVLKITAAGAVMAAVVVAASSLPLAAVVAIGGVVYIAMIRLLRTLDATDLTMIPLGSRLKWLAAR
jgi:O-antigen/teichoic acid export membrane protein